MADENVEDNFWDFLDEEDPFAYVPPRTSETQAYLDWESTASRDRFSEEYAEERFPGRSTMQFQGTFNVPEWFPPEYAAFANTMPYSGMFRVSSFPSTPDFSDLDDPEIVQTLGEAMQGLVEPPMIIGITPEDTLAKNTTSEDFWNPELEVLVPNPNFDASTLPSQFDQVVNNTTTLYDPTKIRTLSGETIAEQDWFTPEKEEVLRTYFADVVNASDPNFFQDIPSMSKGIAWGEFVKALRAGVDPDALWGELEKVADKPNEYWENAKGLNSVFAEGNVAYNVQVMTAERSIEMFDEFTYKLGELRATDPDIYQEIYAYLPIEDKLLYLSDLQSKGSLTKEEYEGLYIQEVNSNYDPEKTPDNYKFVEIEGKVYLDTSGSRELNPSMDLINANFYPDDTSDDPLTKYKNSQDVGRAANGFGTRTDDFDPSFFDALDPIVNIITMIPGIGPIIGATYTAIKGLSGETLHTSDWLRAAPGIIEGINVELIERGIPPIPTTLGEIFPNLPLPFDVTLEVGGGAGAEMTREDGEPFSISDLIVIGDAVLNAPPMPVDSYNSDGSPKRGKYGKILTIDEIRAYESGTMVQLTSQMTQAGVPIPEGAFEVDPQTGMFINLNGESVGFKEIFIAALDLFREEKPKEFAVEIVKASENETTAQSLYNTLGDAVIGGAKFLTEAMAAQAQDGSLAAQSFEGTAFGDFLKEVDQFAISTALTVGGNVLNQINAVYTMGETYPENTDLADLSRHFLTMADESKSENLTNSIKNLQEFQANFEDKVYLEQRTTDEIKNSGGYQAIKRQLDMAVDNGSMTADRRDEILANNITDRKNNTDTYNSIINGAKEFFGGMAEAPLAFSHEAASELGEEAFSFFVASKIGLMAKGILKTSQAVGRKANVKDLTDDMLAQIDKAGNWVTAGGSQVLDLVEAVGGTTSEAYNSAVATQEKVETNAIRESDEFKALIKENSKLVESGAMTEDQFQQAAKDYTRTKLNANDGDLRRRIVAANIAQDVGIFGGVASLVVNKAFGTKFDDKVLKDIFGTKWNAAKELGESLTDKATKWATRTGKDIKEWFSAIGGETLGEGVEEGGVSAYKNILLHQIDPTINIARSVTGDTLLGSTLGATTSSAMGIASALANAGISVPKDSSTGTEWYQNMVSDAASSVTIPGGSIAANAAANFNPAINNALTTTDANGNSLLTEQDVADVFALAGLTPENSPRTYATLMNHAYDGNYVSPQEASQAFYESGYVPSQEEIDAYIGSTEGRDFTDDTLESVIDTYVDPRQLTPDEVNAWAASNGITLTDDQVAELAIQYPDSFNTNDRLLNLLGDGTKVTDLNGNNIPDNFETGVIGSTNNQLPDGTYSYLLGPVILEPGSLIRLENGDDVPSDDPRFGGMYTDFNDNQNADSIDIRDGNARLNSDTGVVEFPDSDGNYDSDLDTSGVDTDGDGILDEDDAFPNDPSEDGLTSIPNEDTGGIDVFDNNGNRVSSIDGQGNTTTYNDDGSSETKNSDNQVTSTTDSGGDITTYQYNGDGSYSTTNSTTGVQTNYDPDGKVIPPDDNETTTTTTGEDGSTTTTTTGVDGSTTVVTDDGKGTVTTVVTDSNGLETTNSTTTNTGDGNTTTTNNIDNSSTTNNTYNTDNSTTDNSTTTNTTNIDNSVSTVINNYGLSADSLADVEEGIEALIKAGLTRDQAIESIATQLGITEGNILDAIDTQTSTITDAIGDQTTTLQTDIDDQTTTLQTDIDGQTTTLQTDISGSTDAILERSNEIESAGIARDQALSTAINEVSTQLGTTRTELLNRIGETEQTLLTRLGEVESTVIQGQRELGEDIQLVADYVGKDVGQVTDADIDFVADIIAQQEANTELAVLTQQQLQYDVNNDGVIDINDQTMLEQAQAGQDVDFARMFNPTGLYEVNQQTQQDIQTAQDLNTQQNLNIQQQIESTRQRGNEEELLRDILGSSDLTGGKASTQQMGTANINYLYDIGGDSVFAPNARTNLFSPYGASNVVPAIQPQARQIRQQPRAAAQGGLLSRNNELLRLLGED